ncbi:MAG: hypothetical protein ACTHKE_02065 [Sphingomicrobium sp.]|jgi:hypothetical protein
MSRVFLFHVLMYGICGYALIRGRTDARIVAAVFLVGNFATLSLRSHLITQYSSVESAVFVIDIVCFLFFTYAALISDRFWPLWVSGLQLTTNFGHVLKAVDAHMLPLAYAAALRFWGYPILIILAVGVWRSRRRLRHDQLSTIVTA